MNASATLGKDLTGLEHMTPDQIRLILDTAEPFKEVSERPIKKVPALRGKTIVNLFFEASTRTRISSSSPRSGSRPTPSTSRRPGRPSPKVKRSWTPRAISRRCGSIWW